MNLKKKIPFDTKKVHGRVKKVWSVELWIKGTFLYALIVHMDNVAPDQPAQSAQEQHCLVITA